MNDYANGLDAGARARLERVLAEGERATGAQVVVALFASLEGESLEDFSIKLAERWKVGFVPEPLTFYRVHGANASHKLERIWKDDEMLRKWLAPRLDGYVSRFEPREVSRAKSHNYAALGTVLTLNGRPSEGRAMYKASLKEQPGRLKSALRYAATFLPVSVFRRLL